MSSREADAAQGVAWEELQRLVRKALSRFEIVVTVDIPGTETAWPRIGVAIRKHEIVDGLQRQYLPAEFKEIAYRGSRPGTGYD